MGEPRRVCADGAVMPPRKLQRLERQINVDLPLDVVERLDAFCDRARYPKKHAIELALRKFLAEYGAITEGGNRDGEA